MALNGKAALQAWPAATAHTHEKGKRNATVAQSRSGPGMLPVSIQRLAFGRPGHYTCMTPTVHPQANWGMGS